MTNPGPSKEGSKEAVQNATKEEMEGATLGGRPLTVFDGNRSNSKDFIST